MCSKRTQIEKSAYLCCINNSQLKHTTMKATEKQRIIDRLVKWGNNANDAIAMVERGYDYVSRVYSTCSIKTKAEVIRTCF